MLDPAQISQAVFLKNGIKRKYTNEAAVFSEQAAITVRTLFDENNEIKAKNIELADRNEKALALIERYESEKDGLLERLNKASEVIETLEKREEASRSIMDNARSEAGMIIERATRKAEEIIRAAKDEQTAILARTDSLIMKKAITFENELKDDVAKWKSADETLRAFKKSLIELAYSMPDGVEAGIGETAKTMWRRLCEKLEQEKETVRGESEAETDINYENTGE